MVNQNGDGDWGVGFDHLGKAPPLCETKKNHKNQFWGTSAYSFRQGSVTWFLGSGSAGADMDMDGDVNGDVYVVPAMPRILTNM